MGWNAGNSSLILGVFVLVVPLSFQLLIQFGFGDIIEFSDNEFKMLSKRGKERTYPWSGLKYYGDGNGFYMIQFGDNPALQIYAGSYSREDWSKLMNFLASHYPERKADGYVGAHLFKLNGKNL